VSAYATVAGWLGFPPCQDATEPAPPVLGPADMLAAHPAVPGAFVIVLAGGGLLLWGSHHAARRGNWATDGLLMTGALLVLAYSLGVFRPWLTFNAAETVADGAGLAL